MNIYAKFDWNRTREKYSKIEGTEMLKKKNKNQMFRLDLAFFKKS